MNKRIKNILKFKFELFITPLFIVLFYYSIKYVGFNNFYNTLFNICVFLSIPAVFIGIRLCRRMIYEVFYED